MKQWWDMNFNDVLADDLLNMLDDKVTVRPRQGESGRGTVYGESYEEVCYMEPGFKNVTDSKGYDVVASLFGVFRGECAIKPNDLIVWGGQSYEAVNVQPMMVGGTSAQVEIYFSSVA